MAAGQDAIPADGGIAFICFCVCDANALPCPSTAATLPSFRTRSGIQERLRTAICWVSTTKRIDSGKKRREKYEQIKFQER
jgi:hypothetical protein